MESHFGLLLGEHIKKMGGCGVCVLRERILSTSLKVCICLDLKCSLKVHARLGPQ